MLLGGLVLPWTLLGFNLYSLAGLAVVATGWALKFILVTRAGYQQGFALERAHSTIRPGWTKGSVG
jgi:hypothetical protein